MPEEYLYVSSMTLLAKQPESENRKAKLIVCNPRVTLILPGSGQQWEAKDSEETSPMFFNPVMETGETFTKSLRVLSISMQLPNSESACQSPPKLFIYLCS